ncbi:MAG: hypothetical protein KAR40_15335 [Candidatus Sabulitectum sp.]|nr:hypothetical protein [Candidatus Sabulitectum sp.]
MLNAIPTQQGPTLRRSGTVYAVPAYLNAKSSTLIPFVFSNEQAQCLEFAHNQIRFVDETGVLTETPITITAVVTESPFVVTVPSAGAVVGDRLALAGFPASLNTNGTIAEITAKAGDDYTLAHTYANPDVLDVSAATAARVYTVASTYTETDLPNLRVLQSLDVIFLFCVGHPVRTLSRMGAVDWALAEVEWRDGPYLDQSTDGVTLTLGATGNATTTASGTGSGSGSGGHAAELAFDEDDSTYWESSTNQTGRIEFTPTTPFVATGYCVFMSSANDDANYIVEDYAPGDFTFEGYDGAAWVVLDAQRSYVLYEGSRSVLFTVKSKEVFDKYALDITRCTRNGPIPPRVSGLAVVSDASALVGVTASAVTGINGGSGFLATDVGRLVRVRGLDNLWRPLRITGYTSPTVVTAKLESAPFPGIEPAFNWRLGAWSETDGWPIGGVFFDDRLVLVGAAGVPDMVAGSVTGDYNNLAPTGPGGEVLADNAINVRLLSRELAKAFWVDTDEKSILIGTGSGVWVLQVPDPAKAFGPLNFKARRASKRGAADVSPIAVDHQLLYVQKARRALRELVYSFDIDGYKVPSLSVFASHIGATRFAQMVYAAEPHSIVWGRQDDGTLAGLTYNRDENVVGWHRHDVGGFVESLCSIPADDERQDVLWMVVRRVIDGQTVRYIERLAPFWDFESTLPTAHFVDSGLQGTFGTPTATVYGLQHLEGEEVYGLADGVEFARITVTDGAITLPQPTTDIVVGMPFTSQCETSHVDAGAEDGTSVGKERRVTGISAWVWDSSGGEVGVYNDESKELEWSDLPYDESPFDEIETTDLQEGILDPVPLPPGYGKRGGVAFRQTKPLPLNILSLSPQLKVSDR